MIDDILAAINRLDVDGTDEFVVTVTVEVRRSQATHRKTVQRQEPRPAPDSGADLTDSHRAVLTAIEDGHCRPTEIEEAVGLKRRRVAELLKDLLESGHLIQPKYGRYERAA